MTEEEGSVFCPVPTGTALRVAQFDRLYIVRRG